MGHPSQADDSKPRATSAQLPARAHQLQSPAGVSDRYSPATAPAPPPKAAKGVKIAVGIATAILALIALAIWALVRALT
jgi:hypothetical protein